MLELFFFISLQSETRHGFKKASKKSARFTVGEKLESRAFVAKKSLVDGMLQKKKKEEKARIKMPTCASNQRNDRIRKKNEEQKDSFSGPAPTTTWLPRPGLSSAVLPPPLQPGSVSRFNGNLRGFCNFGQRQINSSERPSIAPSLLRAFLLLRLLSFFPPLALAGKPHVRPKKAVCGN